MAVLPGISASSMHGAIVPIGYIAASGSSSNMLFTNIPQNYQDLFLVLYMRSSQAVTSPQFYLYDNQDTSTNRSHTVFYGNGSSSGSYRETGSPFISGGYTVGNSATSGIFGIAQAHWLNYTNTTTYKTSLIRAVSDQNGSGRTEIEARLYPSTSAITSISIQNDGGNNWTAGTTAELFGIRTVGQ